MYIEKERKKWLDREGEMRITEACEVRSISCGVTNRPRISRLI